MNQINKAHRLKNWENRPSINTPLNAQNLNELDVSVDVIDDRVITLDTTKFNKTEAQALFKDVSLNQSTGVITFTMVSGATKTIDTILEKIAINFDYDSETQKLVITLEDGTTKYIDMSSLITQYEFLDSETIAFSLGTDGKVSAIVKEGSIEEKHLRPNYLADIRVEVAKAQSSEKAAATSEASALNSAVNAANSATDARESAKEVAQTLDVAGIIVGKYKIGVTADGIPYFEEVNIDPAVYLAEQLETALATADEKATAASASESNALTYSNNAEKSATESAKSAQQSKEYRGGYSFGVEDEIPYLQEEQ